MLYHEQLARTPETMQRLAAQRVTVCGAGALGANICESLARMGYKQLAVIDRDRVEERNLSTQPYTRSDIGAQKAKMLANSIYRAVGLTIEAQTVELTEHNARKLLSGLVVDTFDNSVSRQIVTDVCLSANLACAHVGLASDYAEVIWNERYRVPSPAQDDICDYPLARNLVTLAVGLACETITRFVAQGEQNDYSLTFGDFAVRRL
jgi:molybdopterin/thiamine biosynthesis adenylyltransferase